MREPYISLSGDDAPELTDEWFRTAHRMMNGKRMADLTTATMTTTGLVSAPTIPTTTSANPTNDEELEIDIVDELYPWAADDNEKRRAFIFEYFNWNPDIHVDAQLQQLASIYRWLRGQ